jgi:hypothetical protein
MNRRIHQALGLGLLALYVVVLFCRSTLLPGLAASAAYVPHAFSHAGTGLMVAYGLPLAAIVCFLWPERLMWRFSPRTPPDYAFLLTEGFWYALGYFLLLVGIGVLLLFRAGST